MYDKLIKNLRVAGDFVSLSGYQRDLMREAADAIEELSRAKEELAKRVAYWQAQLIQAMCGETLADLEKSCWTSVTEEPLRRVLNSNQ